MGIWVGLDMLITCSCAPSVFWGKVGLLPKRAMKVTTPEHAR